MLVPADLRQFPAHSERHEKHAEHVVIEVAHAGCLRRRDAARPCEAAVPCISVICTTAARASGPAETATIVALCAGWDIMKLLASARGTKGGMKVFWTEGSGRVREKAKRIGRMLAVYRPPDGGQLQQNCRPDPARPRFLVAARSASRTLSLFFASRRHPCEPPVQCTCVRCVGLSFLSVGGASSLSPARIR